MATRLMWRLPDLEIPVKPDEAQSLIDWLRQDMEHAVFDALKDMDKVPYNENGVEMVKNAIKQVLHEQGYENIAIVGETHGGRRNLTLNYAARRPGIIDSIVINTKVEI